MLQLNWDILHPLEKLYDAGMQERNGQNGA